MDVAQNILVVKTVSGMAMAVAAAIDAMKLKEIVGCIAGDDTIMLVLHNEADAIKLKEIVGCSAGDDTIMLVLHSETDAIKTMENIKEAMES